MSKILVHFRPIGNASILKTPKFFIESTYEIRHILFILKNKLLVFKDIYILVKDNHNNNYYYPDNSETLGNLYEKYNINKELLFSYSYFENQDENQWNICLDCRMQKCTCGKEYQKIIDNNLNEILINIKILSNLKEGDKLIVNQENEFLIDTPDWFQGIRRWYGNRNREISITYLILFLNKLLNILNYIEKDKESFKENIEIISLYNYIEYLNKGLDNLMLTYEKDINITNKLVKICDKLKKIKSLI